MLILSSEILNRCLTFDGYTMMTHSYIVDIPNVSYVILKLLVGMSKSIYIIPTYYYLFRIDKSKRMLHLVIHWS